MGLQLQPWACPEAPLTAVWGLPLRSLGPLHQVVKQGLTATTQVGFGVPFHPIGQHAVDAAHAVHAVQQGVWRLAPVRQIA